jgi:hypothetical protein
MLPEKTRDKMILVGLGLFVIIYFIFMVGLLYKSTSRNRKNSFERRAVAQANLQKHLAGLEAEVRILGCADAVTNGMVLCDATPRDQLKIIQFQCSVIPKRGCAMVPEK